MAGIKPKFEFEYVNPKDAGVTGCGIAVRNIGDEFFGVKPNEVVWAVFVPGANEGDLPKLRHIVNTNMVFRD